MKYLEVKLANAAEANNVTELKKLTVNGTRQLTRSVLEAAANFAAASNAEEAYKFLSKHYLCGITAEVYIEAIRFSNYTLAKCIAADVTPTTDDMRVAIAMAVQEHVPGCGSNLTASISAMREMIKSMVGENPAITCDQKFVNRVNTRLTNFGHEPLL